MVPNSDKGHLFVELEQALAVDWQAQILVRGPMGANGHLPLKMEEVRSTDTSVVEVEGFEATTEGEQEAIRLDLEILGQGEARLEFEFSVDGEYEIDGEEAPQELTDSFAVEAREVSSVGLSRMLEEVNPQGAYGRCPQSGLGTYLMDHLEEYVVNLYFEKRDAEGNLLRGSGKFPFEITPEGAVELEEVDERRHIVEMRPRAFGSVKVEPTRSGSPLEAHFKRVGDITQMEARLHLLNQEGRRSGEASAMVLDGLYEVEIRPHLPEGGPLCGGAVASEVQSLSPAICDVVGQVVDSGNPAIVANQIGECHLRLTLEGAAGGQGLVEEPFLEVQPAW